MAHTSGVAVPSSVGIYLSPPPSPGESVVDTACRCNSMEWTNERCRASVIEFGNCTVWKSILIRVGDGKPFVWSDNRSLLAIIVHVPFSHCYILFLFLQSLNEKQLFDALDLFRSIREEFHSNFLQIDEHLFASHTITGARLGVFSRHGNCSDLGETQQQREDSATQKESEHFGWSWRYYDNLFRRLRIWWYCALSLLLLYSSICAPPDAQSAFLCTFEMRVHQETHPL